MGDVTGCRLGMDEAPPHFHWSMTTITQALLTAKPYGLCLATSGPHIRVSLH